MSQATFVVKIMCTRNSTWQGEVNWFHDQQAQSLNFRSALELIRIMDSSLPDTQE